VGIGQIYIVYLLMLPNFEVLVKLTKVLTNVASFSFVFLKLNLVHSLAICFFFLTGGVLTENDSFGFG
jgi:hypothetical protein